MFWLKLFQFREADEEQKSFVGHLEDLRGTILRIVFALGISMTLCFFFRFELADLIQRPLAIIDPTHSACLQSIGVPDSLMVSLQVSFYAGLVTAFPFILYFLGCYIVPALKETEKKLLIPAVIAGSLLFIGGSLFAFSVVLPMALDFFFQDAKKMNWNPVWTVRDYYSFATQFIIAFGLSFELPIAIVLLVKLGLISIEKLRQSRAFAVVAIFFFAAVITPTQDAFTLLLMGGPMVILYEISIFVAAFFEPPSSPSSPDSSRTSPPITPSLLPSEPTEPSKSSEPTESSEPQTPPTQTQPNDPNLP